MNTHDMIELPPMPDPIFISDHQGDGEYFEVEDMQDYALAAIEPYAKRIAELEASRIAYASEFAPDENGNPDVGSIHENIRKLKADRKRRGEPVAWIRKNGFRFISEIEPQDDSEVPLYAAPQPDEPVKSTCKKCNGTGAESTRFHGVWPNGEECLEQIKCDQCDGFGTASVAEPVAADFPAKGKVHGPLGWIANNTNPEPVEDSVDIDDFIAAFIARGDITKEAFLEARQWVRDTYYNPAESVKTLIDNQEPLGEEFQRVLDEHSWDLYVKTNEPVKVDAEASVPSDDALDDALSNLEHDNYEQSYSGYKNRQADIALIRTALARYKKHI